MRCAYLLIMIMFLVIETQTPQVPTTSPAVPLSYGPAGQAYRTWGFAVSRDNTTIVLAGGVPIAEGGWACFELATRKSRAVGKMEGFGANCIAISPDKRFVAAGGNADDRNGAELRLFNAASGQPIAHLRGHYSPFGFGQALAFTPDSKHLISLAYDDIIRVWTIPDGKPVARYCFVSRLRDRNYWRRQADPCKEKPKTEVVHNLPVEALQAIAIAPDGRTLAVTTATNELILMDTFTGQIKHRLRCKRIEETLSVSYSADGSLLAVGGALEGGFIEVWSRDGREFLKLLGKHRSSVLCMAISPANHLLASGGLEDGVRVWNLKTGKQLYRLHQPAGPDEYNDVRSLAFACDGRLLITNKDGDGGLRFWRARDGKPTSPSKP